MNIERYEATVTTCEDYRITLYSSRENQIETPINGLRKKEFKKGKGKRVNVKKGEQQIIPVALQ